MTNRRQVLAHALLLLAVICAAACGGGGGRQSSAQGERPPLGPEQIRHDINGRYVRVPSADDKSKQIDWVFDPREPQEIEIVEQKIEGDAATFLVNMKTHTLPRSQHPRSFAGQLRLHYRLESGLVLRRWEIDEIENVSLTYVDEPPPSPAGEKKGEGDAKNAGSPSTNANVKPDANPRDARKPPAPPPPRP